MSWMKKELDEALKSLDYPIRYYQRLIAMKLISVDHNHKETGEILGVSYRTINRWAKACEKEGLNSLIPNWVWVVKICLISSLKSTLIK